MPRHLSSLGIESGCRSREAGLGRASRHFASLALTGPARAVLGLARMPLPVLMIVVASPLPLSAQPAETEADPLHALVGEMLGARDEAAWRDLLDANPDAVTSELAESLLALATGSARRGEFSAALRANAIASEIAARLASDLLTARCRQSAAAISYRQQDYSRSVAEAQRAVALAVAGRGEDPVAAPVVEAAARVTLGHALYGLCRYDAALEEFGRARSVAQATDLPLVAEADALVGVGNVRLAIGEYDLAAAAYREALDIYKEYTACEGGLQSIMRRLMALSASASGPGLANSLAACFNNLGIAQHEMGRHGDALEYLEVARAFHRALGDLPEEARALGNLGSVYAALGRYGEARESLQAASQLGVALGLSGEVARAQLNLATLDMSEDRPGDARKRLRRAADLLEALGDRSLRAVALNALGCLLAGEERYARALREYERALDIAVEVGARSREAVIRHNMACVRLWQADGARQPDALEKAWFGFSQAREVAGEIGDRETLWRAAYGVGLTLQAQGDRAAGTRRREQWQAARVAYDDSIEAIEGMHFRLRETEFAGTFLGVDDKYRVYEDMVGLLGKLGEAEDGLQYLQRARYAALTDRLRLSAISTGDEALDELLDRYDELMRQRDGIFSLLAQELARPEAQKSPERLQSLTELSRGRDAEVHRVWTAMNQIAPEISSLARPSPARWVMDPDVLPRGALLVQYLPAQSQLLIFAARREGRPKFVSVDVGRAELSSRIERVRGLLREAGAEGRPTGAPMDRQLRDLLVRLHADLIAPIEADLRGAEVLVILPYGMLYYLPFAALARETGPDEVTFLSEDIAIAYLNELTAYGLGTVAPPTFQEPSVLTAFANPDGSLPSADREVSGIAALLPRSQREVHLGEDADRAAALDLPRNTGVVHFATHGVLNRQDLNESYLVLADGRLRQWEVYGLGLGERGTHLAVLSACQTFPGQEQPGVEVLGLADAFIKSGAEAVLASLWAVQTESTAELMVRFYQRLLKDGDISRAEALRQAQLGVLRDGRHAHPYFWAPFVLYGDWR